MAIVIVSTFHSPKVLTIRWPLVNLPCRSALGGGLGQGTSMCMAGLGDRQQTDV